MNIRNITALLAAALLTVSVLSGCSPADKSPPVSDSASESAAPISETGLNPAAAYASLDPKTVMVTVDGREAAWSEFFYLLNYMMNDLEAQGAPVTDWSAEYAGGMSYEEYLLDSVVNILKQNAAIDYGASQLGVALSEEDKAAVQADWEAQIAVAGSEEALLDMLEAQFGSKEIFDRLDSLSYLADRCFAEMYGSDGGKLSDQEVADHTAEDGYLMAKHILLLTSTTDESGISTPLTEEENAKTYKEMEKILSDLQAYSGDDFETYFDQVMTARSQDPGGLAMYPDGYLFQDGDMVSAFEEGTKALEIGQISGIVETDYGYHIIYRIPIDYDATPMAYSGYGAYSLRYLTAVDMFRAVLETWMDSMTVVYNDAYENLDLGKIFSGA